MEITVIGGGNIGTLMAAEAAAKGHNVTMYTSRPKAWNRQIEVYNADGGRLCSGILSKITDSLHEACEAADYIWITLPAHMFDDLSVQMLPFVHTGQKIGVIPGSGGAEFAFRRLVLKGCILFGLQRVHSIARIKEYGKAVYELGRKPEMQIGAIPSFESREISRMLESIFLMPCKILDNYLAVTLTPSNPILHTTRLYTMFKDYTPGMVYPRNYLFYEEWTDACSEVLLACDSELQKLCSEIPLELRSVIPLSVHYESSTPEAMTEKIRSIKAFKGLLSPMQQTESGWIPDWQSRYFAADFSYGLKIIKDIAELFHVSAPYINEVWKWFVNASTAVNKKQFIMNLNRDEFIKLYQ